MNVGTLTLEMAANVARLQADMAKATSTVEGAAAKMRAAANNAAKALGAIGAGLSIAGLASFVRGAIDAADETSKLASKIGVTTKEVAGLQLAFRQSGIAPDSLTTSMARLAKGLSEGNDGLKALGISSKNTDGTLKTTRQVLGEVADKFQSTGDGITKSATAVEIFGKSGAELIPLLNGGAEGLAEFDRLAAKLGLTIEESTAKQAELFNDTLDLVGQGVQGVGRQIAAQLLPTLTGLASEFFNTATSGDTLKKTADFLASALKVLYITGLGVVELFSSMGKLIGGVSAAIVAGLQGNFSEAKSILGEVATDIGTSFKATLAQIDSAWNTTGDSAVSNLARVNKAQMETKESLDASKKAAEEFAKLIKSLQGDLAKSAAESEAAQNGYNKAQQEFIAFARSDVFAKLTNAQKAQVAALFEQKIAIEQSAEAQRDFNKALEESEAARVKTLTATDEAITKLGENNQALREEIELIGLTERQQLAVVQARNESAIALKAERLALLQKLDIGREEQGQLADEIRLLQERNQLLGQKLGAQEAATTYANLKAEGERFVQDLERGLTDSLFRAFESGKGFFKTLWDGIKNLFKTTVLKLAIQGVVGSVLGSVGLSSAAQTVASTGGSGLSALSNLGSLASTVSGFGAAFGTSFGANLSASFASGFSTVGLSLEAGLASIAQGTVTGIASGLGSLAAVAAPAAAALVVANALGFFRSNKTVGYGLAGTLGAGDINDYALNRRGGTLFSGPSYSVQDRGVAAQSQALQDAYGAIRTTVAGMAEQLGLGSDAIKTFTVRLGNDLIHPDTGGYGIKLEGLTQDQILAKIEEALLSANEQLAAFALGTTEFTRDGETAVQTLGRLTGSLGSVNSVFKTLGLTLADASLAGADAASKFIDSFGGADQFAQVASSYYQNFYTEAERTANTVEGLRQRFYELGTAGATTREGFRALVEEQQRLHGATSPVVAELLKLESTFASIVPAIESVTDAAASLVSQASVDQFDRAGSLQAVRDYEAQQLEILRINQENADKAYQLEQLASGEAVNTEAGVRSLISILAELGDASQLTAEQVANAAVQAGATGSVARGQFGVLSANFQSSEQRVKGLFPLDSAGNFTATPEDLFTENANIRRLTEFLLRNASDEIAIFLEQLSQSTASADEKIAALNATLENFAPLAQSAGIEFEGIANQTLGGLNDALAELSNQAVDATVALREKEGLELRILQLQGNTAELRRLELAALDPSNRSLQEFIFLLEDQARLEADAMRLSDAFGSIRDSVRQLIDGLLIDSQRSILSPSQILAEAERQYRANLAGAFEGDTQAAGRLGGSVNSLLEAARNGATSEVDYNRTFGRTLGDLNGLESFAGQRATTEDVVAELRAVKQELAEVNRKLAEQNADSRVGMATVAKNTADTSTLLRRWEGDGLPETRDTDGTTVVIGA